MSKEISSAISSVMQVAANNPPLVLAIATGGAVLMLGSSIAYKLATQGKSVKFDIEGLMKFEAEFHEFS